MDFSNNGAFSAEYLRDRLHYDPETGIFNWLPFIAYGSRWNNKNVGRAAGYKSHKWRQIMVDKVAYQAHRLAWLYMTGEWPDDEIDHCDTNGLNNQWSNLRKATHSDNQSNIGLRQNNTSGAKGVSYHKEHGRWQAGIGRDNHSIFLGYYDTIEEAAEAYNQAALMLYGEFARTT